jgi:hypothetical protein
MHFSPTALSNGDAMPPASLVSDAPQGNGAVLSLVVRRVVSRAPPDEFLWFHN